MALLTGLTTQAIAATSVESTNPTDSTSAPADDSILQPGPPTEPEEDVTEVPPGDVDKAPELPEDSGKSSEQPAAEHCGPRKAVYRPTANKGKKIKTIGPKQANHNGTSRTMTSKFIAEAGGEVGIAFSGELKVSASAMVGEIEQKYGVELSLKLNAKIGNWVEVKTPPHKTTFGKYGVWRMKNTGTSYIINSNCTTTPKKAITSYTPWYVGWHVWEG
ncbi:hypothetical protein ACFXJM_28605 [Streptomyces massasporeus]